MLSYVTMLILIMFFLEAMWAGPAINWSVHAFGLAATAGLLVTTVVFLRKRLKKTEVQYQQSHETDWMFLVLLIVVAATGIVQFTLHRLGLDTAANINYVIHMMAVVPMLLLEVPFSKWSHMAYRPLAMYFADLKAEEMVSKEREAVGAPQAA
jgi:heterodisulfide reductase subunit C/quinone-modifying oxidoreductase subunit QmoC